MKKKIGPHPLGIWTAYAALVLISLGWLMQAYSLYDWEGAVESGLQNASFKGGAVEQAAAVKERGEAVADLLVWFILY